MSEQGVIGGQTDAPVGARCLRCGYALRGLTTNTCPECGESFEPTQPWTMWLPGAWRRREMGSLRPVGWNYRRLKWLLVLIVVGSAWFVAPHPKPTLLLVCVWLVYALPYLRRREARRRLFAKNPSLPAELRQVDDADIWRLRKYFTIAFLIVATQLPFAVAYAISYPFLEPTARHWVRDVPWDSRPPGDLIVRGVLVGRIRDNGLYISFETPTGTIAFSPHDGWDRLAGYPTPSW
jgi:hypothetical protein